MKFYWPVRIDDGAFINVGNLFGANPSTYAQFNMNGHNGLDFIVGSGKPVYASCSGNVLYRQDLDAQGQFRGFGNYATITNQDGSTYYAHLERFNGADRQVQAGDVIGFVDSTGFSTGAHLHFGFRPINPNLNNGFGGCVDPQPFLADEKEKPDMIEFVHKTGSQEYGFLETTQFSSVYYRGISEEDIKFQAKKFGANILKPDGTINFALAKEITL